MSPSLSAIAVAMIVLLIIMAVLPVVPAVFPTDVLAVNPMMPLVVARDPHHFVVAVPIARAVVVERPVANLDRDAVRSHNGWSKNARRNNGCEQKFVFNHPPTDHALTVPANTVLVARDTFLVWPSAQG